MICFNGGSDNKIRVGIPSKLQATYFKTKFICFVPCKVLKTQSSTHSFIHDSIAKKSINLHLKFFRLFCVSELNPLETPINSNSRALINVNTISNLFDNIKLCEAESGCRVYMSLLCWCHHHLKNHFLEFTFVISAFRKTCVR